MEFFDQEIMNGYVSIYERQITFNSKLIKYFDDCLKVRIGFEVSEKKIYVFLLDADYANSGEFKESSLLSVKVSKTYARISSKALVEVICAKFNLEIPSKSYLQFKAIFDETKKAIIIDLEV